MSLTLTYMNIYIYKKKCNKRSIPFVSMAKKRGHKPHCPTHKAHQKVSEKGSRKGKRCSPFFCGALQSSLLSLKLCEGMTWLCRKGEELSGSLADLWRNSPRSARSVGAVSPSFGEGVSEDSSFVSDFSVVVAVVMMVAVSVYWPNSSLSRAILPHSQ